jgi:hypothetical protein
MAGVMIGVDPHKASQQFGDGMPGAAEVNRQCAPETS